ncbi:DMT family transporter [Variovorax sp. VNK109]|uniref:DMT family transporter n=1 Tax=Variovorax sp. VNK109 TaxID=3400919 RepID=UPI003C001062
MSAVHPVAAHSKPLVGIGFSLIAFACFGTLDTIVKYVSTAVPVLMALWFRYAFQAVATTLVVVPSRGRGVWHTRHLGFQVLRGVLLLACSVLAFYSLRFMPVGEFTAIVMITPLVITLLATLALGERVRPFRWALVSGGFAGTIMIIRPGGEAFDWGLLLPLALVACNSWFQVLTSRMARTEDPITTHLYTGWVGTLLAAAALPFVWVDIGDWTLWILMAMMGLMGAIGHFLLILAYTRAPAATITPYMYSQIGFAMIGGWIVFSHVPDGWAFLGIGLIAVCGAVGAWLTAREGRVRVEPAES